MASLLQGLKRPALSRQLLKLCRCYSGNVDGSYTSPSMKTEVPGPKSKASGGKSSYHVCVRANLEGVCKGVLVAHCSKSSLQL